MPLKLDLKTWQFQDMCFKNSIKEHGSVNFESQIQNCSVRQSFQKRLWKIKPMTLRVLHNSSEKENISLMKRTLVH